MADHISRIRTDGATNVDFNYVDVWSHLELDETKPRILKPRAWPIHIACFLPVSWDLRPTEESATDVAHRYLGLDRLLNLDSDGPSEEVRQRRREILQNLVPLDDTEGVLHYEAVSDAFREARTRPLDIDSLSEEDFLRSGDELKISPLKLLLAALAYDHEVLDEPEHRDAFALLCDKIALAATLPLLFAGWPRLTELQEPAPEEPSSNESSLTSKFDAHLLRYLQKFDVCSRPTDGRLFDEEYYVSLTSEERETLLTFATTPEGRPDRVLFPVDDLDVILSRHLRNAFGQLLGEKLTVDSDSEVWNAIKEEQEDLPANERRRTDHGFFFPLITSFLENERGGMPTRLNLLKLRYQGEEHDPLMPFIEVVDLRPPIWARQAMDLTTEIRIAAKEYEMQKKRFDDGSAGGNSSKTYNALRRATRQLSDAKTNFKRLQQQVVKEGLQLTLKDLSSDIPESSLDSVDKFFTLTQKEEQVYQVKVRRRELERWTEWRSRRVCRRFLFFKRCRTIKVATSRQRWRVWYETHVRRRSVDRLVNLDYDPVGSYLERRLSKDVFGPVSNPADIPEHVQERVRSFARSEGAPYEQPAIEAGQFNTDDLTNGSKEVHIFQIDEEGTYRDQQGVSLDALLNDLENDVEATSRGVDPRMRKLFLIPVVERLVTGELETVKYLAVHNPIKGRLANAGPRIFLRETYQQSFSQEPGHWLGALSHVVSLFPGEEREITLTTENRSSTTDRSEIERSNQRTSSNKADVRDQVRRELTSTHKRSSKSRWSASVKAGASYGPFSASGSASRSSSRSQSSERTAAALNDTVSKVASNVSRSNEVVFRTDSEKTTSRSESSVQKVAFRNVNQGRAVNHKFFQIQHKYCSEVSLSDVRLLVEYGDELIPGLGIVRTDVFPIEETDRLLEELVEQDRKEILDHVFEVLQERLESHVEIGQNNGTSLVSFKPEDEQVIKRREFYVNSGGFFVESEVSSQPATEDYVERIRDAEVKRHKAETERAKAVAEALARGQVVLPDNIGSLTIQTEQPLGSIDSFSSGDGIDSETDDPHPQPPKEST